MKVPDLECIVRLSSVPGNEGKGEILTRGLDFWLELVSQAYLSKGNSEMRFKLSIEPADVLYVTDEQRGYLHILGGAAQALLNTQGWNVQTPHDALTLLKTVPGIDFTEERTVEGEIVKVPLSLKHGEATREQVSRFVDNLFNWLVEQGAKPQTADEYKKWKKWKSAKRVKY